MTSATSAKPQPTFIDTGLNNFQIWALQNPEKNLVKSYCP